MPIIRINCNAYLPHAPVPWDDAIAAGGFYFDRARYLGLPEPPAILFTPNHPSYLTVMGRYHALFKAAEADVVAHIQTTFD